MLNVIDNNETLTPEHFLSSKKYAPFVRWRTYAKGVNFGCLFGAKAPAFAGILLASSYSEKDADEFIAEMGYEQELQEKLAENQLAGNRNSVYMVKLILCASKMRAAFFDMYNGFFDRILRERKFALDKGYVRDYQGPVRHLPELKYLKVGKNLTRANEYAPGLTGYDKKAYSRVLSHLLNNAVNSPIQSLEANVAFPTWYEIERIARSWGLKSYIWNNIHDSLDFVIYKPELELMIALANDCSAWEREPVYGIHMSFEPEVSDVSDEEHRASTYWKHGIEVPTVPVEEALKRFNLKHRKDLKWDGCEHEYDYLTPDWYRRRGIEIEYKPYSKVDKISHNAMDFIEGAHPDKEFNTKNGCKVTRKFCREGGNRSYFLSISDFNSLEVRCAAQDTYFNEAGMDPVLQDIYKDGGSGDLHTMTGWSVFCKPVNQKVVHVEDVEKGKTYHVARKSIAHIRRDGKETAVFAPDLKETDELIEFWTGMGTPTLEHAAEDWHICLE